MRDAADGLVRPAARQPGCDEPRQERDGGRRGRDRKRRVRAGLDRARRDARRRAPDCFEIEVVDNGPGLPRQNRSRLLEPYVTTKGHKGTGLGLAMSKITEQHGGTLALEDAPPRRTEQRRALVRITLPRRGAPGAALPDDSDDTPGPAPAVAVRREPEPQPSRAGDASRHPDRRRRGRYSRARLRHPRRRGTAHDSRATATRRCAPSRSAVRTSSSSTSGCRAAASTASRCSQSSSAPTPTCRW